MNSSPRKLRRDTRVFISAVSRELGSVRKLAKKGLEDNDYHAVEQENFPPDYRQLMDKLRERIESCDAVLHIAGRCYGAEPQQRPDGAPRRSYTQMEYDLAVELGKPVYVFLTADSFPTDPHEPEDEERTRLQAEHRQRLIRTGQDYNPAATREELDQKIRSLQLKIESLQEELTHVDAHVAATDRRLSQRFTIGAVIVVVLVGGIGWSISQLRRDVPKVIEDAQKKTDQKIESTAQETKEGIKDALQEAVYELTNPVVLAERIRKEIHATAEEKIKALPDEKGRGRLIAEIEKERDLALGRVDDLIKLIQEGLKEGASPVFQHAAEILQKEGTDEALAYLESRRPSTLETARRYAEQVKAAQARADAEKALRNKSLQALVLEAELLETKLQWEPALKLREQVAELAPDWFEARNLLGKLHLTVARFTQAEPHLRATVKLAATHAEESIALNNLAQLLQATNRLAEAEPLMRRALAINEQSFGREHPDVAIFLNNLAALLKNTNRLAEAEPLMRRALAIDEQSYGAENPNVALDLNNLAVLLQATNRLAEAEPLMRRALAIDGQSYGAEHPDVARDLNNLAQLLQATNRLSEAEPLMRRALVIYERTFGSQHPSVATCLGSLGELFMATNRQAEAELLMRRALVIGERSYGAEHPTVALHLNNLALLLKATKRLAEAEPLMRRALAIDEQSYGTEHPNVARDLNNLSTFLQATNRLVDAEPLMRRALAIDEQSYGAKHPHVASFLNNLAQLLNTTNRQAEAEPLMRRALAIDEQAHGADHPDVAIDLNNLAELLRATNRLTEAEPLMRRALAINEQSYGAEHPDVASCLNNLVALLQKTNRLAEAEPLSTRRITILFKFKHRTGNEHPDLRSELTRHVTLLLLMKLKEGEIVQRLNEAKLKATNNDLQPIVPDVERLLGPTQDVSKVLTALDRQYKADDKPAVYFLALNQPMAPHLAELLKPNPDSLTAAGVSEFSRGDHATAVAHYEESLKLLADKPDQAATTFTTRMNRAAALRELGEVEPARDELRKLLSALREEDTITTLAKGRARYHLALCEWRLGDRDTAQRCAEESLTAYGDDKAAAPQKKQTEQLLADLKENKSLPPLAKVDAVAALEQARVRFRARAELATLPLTQSALPLLDQMLGPAELTQQVFERLDRQYREQNKSAIWFLPLSQPIAPHLDELLGPLPKKE